MSDLDVNSKERALWIRGKLGVGKSTMAGYFIDLLKQLSPNSVIAYFFCKSGRVGLTAARDIVRTLCHQIIRSKFNALSVVEGLKRNGFSIDHNVGISLLVEQFLREPLLHTNSDVYIILDGLDEADFATRDRTELKPISEMEILITRLATLTSTRLLFISRPEADICRMVPNLFIKSISIKDVQIDINSYVQQKIDHSQRLQRHFQREGIDPFNYFRRNAKGIFLWVVIVLQQLEKINSASIFKKYLDGFSEASGDMGLLYSRVLLRFNEYDQRWVKEILRWLVVKQGSLGVGVLKEAVEMALNDELSDFANFLEVDCGSILDVKKLRPTNDPWTPSEDTAVELIHETLRSYLTNGEHCDSEFHLDNEKAHRCALERCVDVLLGEISFPNFRRYAGSHWVDHLIRGYSKTGPTPQNILRDLHRFFESGGCKSWVKVGNFRPPRGSYRFPARIFIEDIYLEAVHEYLRQWNADVQTDGVDQKPNLCDANSAARHWGLGVLNSPWRLSEYLGKAAAEIWLYEKSIDFGTPFWLSMKQYCKIHGHDFVFTEDLHPLAFHNFTTILGWLDDQGDRVPRDESLGDGFRGLSLWNESRLCYMRATGVDSKNLRVWLNLRHTCMKLKDHDGSIGALTESLKLNKCWTRLADLGTQLRLKGDLEAAITAFEEAIQLLRKDERLSDFLHHVPHMFLDLGAIYASRKDYFNEIRTFEKLVEYDPKSWWAWQCLREAYTAIGDIRGTIDVHRTANILYSHQNWSETGFSEEEKMGVPADHPQQPPARGRTSALVVPESAHNPDNQSSADIGSSSEVHGTPRVQQDISLTSPRAHLMATDRECQSIQPVRWQNGKQLEDGWFFIPNKKTGFQFDVCLLQELENINQIMCVEFSGDGEYIAISYSKAVRILSIRSGKMTANLVYDPDLPVKGIDLPGKHSREPTVITTIRLSADGVSLVMGAGNGRIQAWNVREGRAKHTLDQNAPLRALSLSLDGCVLASSSDKVVWIWDLKQGENVVKIADFKFWGPTMALSPDGRLLALDGFPDRVSVYDTRTGELRRHFQTEEKVVCTNLYLTENQLACACNNGAVVKWVLEVSAKEDETITVEQIGSAKVTGASLPKAQLNWSSDFETFMTSDWSINIELWTAGEKEPCFMLCDPDITWAYWRISLYCLRSNLANEVVFAKNATSYGGMFASWSSHRTLRVWRYERK